MSAGAQARRASRSFRWSLLAAIVVIACSCRKSPFEVLRESLQEHRRLWETREPVNYSYTYLANAGAVDPRLRVTVRNRGIVSVILLPDSTTRPIDQNLLIDRVFDLIDEHFRRPGAAANIDYSSDYGFPARAEMSIRGVADSYMVITITDFRIDP